MKSADLLEVVGSNVLGGKGGGLTCKGALLYHFFNTNSQPATKRGPWYLMEGGEAG